MSERTCRKCLNYMTHEDHKEKPVEVNADGDSIAVMKAVQDELGKGAVAYWNGEWFVNSKWLINKTMHPREFRITAKHATTFDAKCMDVRLFFEAALDQGDMLRCDSQVLDGGYVYFDKLTRGMLTSTTGMPWSCASLKKHNLLRITKAQHAAESSAGGDSLCLCGHTKDQHKEFGGADGYLTGQCCECSCSIFFPDPKQHAAELSAPTVEREGDDFDYEAPSCTNCGDPMSLNEGCDWPEEYALRVCDRCAQELYAKYWREEQELNRKAAAMDPFKKIRELQAATPTPNTQGAPHDVATCPCEVCDSLRTGKRLPASNTLYGDGAFTKADAKEMLWAELQLLGVPLSDAIKWAVAKLVLPYGEGAGQGGEVAGTWGCSCGRVHLEINGSTVAVEGGRCSDADLVAKHHTDRWTGDMIKEVLNPTPTQGVSQESLNTLAADDYKEHGDDPL